VSIARSEFRGLGSRHQGSRGHQINATNVVLPRVFGTGATFVPSLQHAARSFHYYVATIR
jgi:hypothetical protein